MSSLVVVGCHWLLMVFGAYLYCLPLVALVACQWLSCAVLTVVGCHGLSLVSVGCCGLSWAVIGSLGFHVLV